MRDDLLVPRRHSPPTPRSAKLGRELRRLREAKGLTTEQVAAALEPPKSQSWVSRVEKGLVKIRWSLVTELLPLYGVRANSEQGRALIELAKSLHGDGWWQRMNTLPLPLLQYIAFEAEAAMIFMYDPILVPGLFQTESYARALAMIGRETKPEEIQQRVENKLSRQAILTRAPNAPFVHAVISEAALRCQVGGVDVLSEQIGRLVDLASRDNITIQVLRFEAGAHMADRGSFSILGFGEGDPDLGCVDTVTGSLFLEGPAEIDWLGRVWSDIVMRAMSPAESVRYMSEMREQ